jgi:Cytochrome c554 and c-prime
MRRIDFRPWAGLALSVAVLGYVGCTSSDRAGSSPAAAKVEKAGAGGSADEGSGSQLLLNLPKPAAALIFTGEMENYLEPCGCTEGQVGGLVRRYDFLERLHKQDWPTVQLDLGTLTKDPRFARGGFDQAKIKFDYAVRALKLLDYSALALSPEDLKLGVMEALGLLNNSLGEKAKVVVANVAAPAGFESVFRTSQVVTAGPVKVGVTAVIDPESLEKLNDPDKEMLTAGLQRPGDVLPAVLAELEPKTDYQVLMVQGPPELAKNLATSYPGFDVVVSTSEYADPQFHDPVKLHDGKTLLVQVGKMGKYVGVVGLYPREAERMRYYPVRLGTKYDGPAASMKELIEEDFRKDLRQMQVVENFPRRDYISDVSGATYIGAENCKSCHPNTYTKWSTTKHFLAYDKLLEDKRPNVIYDAECVTCHTTGFEYNSGWKSPAETPYLKGNQCENCHGPGSKHVADPNNVDYRKAMALTPEKADKNRLCLGCHDGDNSPKFDFGTHYPQIAHKGLDDYKDPKVRVGITPKLVRSGAASGGGTASK